MAGLLQPQQAQEQIPPNAEQPQGQSDGADENNPQFVQAMQFAMTALYQNNAGEKLAKAIAKSPDKVQTMADGVYEILSVATERVDIDPEFLPLMATHLLEEVTSIGEAVGVEFSPADIGNAFKQMILRFMGEAGYDTAELQVQMDQVSPEQFNQVASQVMEAA